MVAKTLDPEVSVPEFQEYVQEFIDSDAAKNAVGEFKQCFLNQSNETLQNFDLMMVINFISFFFLMCPLKSLSRNKQALNVP